MALIVIFFPGVGATGGGCAAGCLHKTNTQAPTSFLEPRTDAVALAMFFGRNYGRAAIALSVAGLYLPAIALFTIFFS